MLVDQGEVRSEGERDRSIPPVIDGTMGTADALANLLVGYLRLLGVKAAAVEHLQDFADPKKGWSEKFRKQWVTKNRKLLRSGKIKKVIENIKAVAKGRKLEKMKTELNYFIKNASKMKYAWFKRCRLPIGSGAVESCIRRVVNPRMKCPSTYWKEENAEGFLHLRSLYKSGRWDAGFLQTLETQAQAVAS